MKLYEMIADLFAKEEKEVQLLRERMIQDSFKIATEIVDYFYKAGIACKRVETGIASYPWVEVASPNVINIGRPDDSCISFLLDGRYSSPLNEEQVILRYQVLKALDREVKAD